MKNAKEMNKLASDAILDLEEKNLDIIMEKITKYALSGLFSYSQRYISKYNKKQLEENNYKVSSMDKNGCYTISWRDIEEVKLKKLELKSFNEWYKDLPYSAQAFISYDVKLTMYNKYIESAAIIKTANDKYDIYKSSDINTRVNNILSNVDQYAKKGFVCMQIEPIIINDKELIDILSSKEFKFTVVFVDYDQPIYEIHWDYRYESNNGNKCRRWL